MLAQTDEPKLKLSLQTALLAYPTAGGWSAWGSAQLGLHKLSLAYVTYPNRWLERSPEKLSPHDKIMCVNENALKKTK